MSFVLLFFLSTSLFAFSAGDVKVFTLENGLTIYFLEDASSPTVRLELCVNAGFTCQGRGNGGLFTLYARLLGGEISNDSVRFVSVVAPNAAERAVIALSEKLKPLRVSDGELNALLKTMSAEYKEYEASAAGFINAAIDSKVFAAEPWTRESGVSGAAFSARTGEEVRSLLQYISDFYYNPAVSSLFISGNLTQSAALTLAKKYFSALPARSAPREELDDRARVQKAIAAGALGSGRKFVLAHKDFSDEMTQIVVQYAGLAPDEADALAFTWNRDGSAFKKLLLKQRNLSILGDEYIDVSSAQERHASRLVIQSLLGGAKVSPVVQADLFLQMSRDSDVFSKRELQGAVKSFRMDFVRLSESSGKTMEQLSRSVPLCGSDEDVISAFFRKDARLSSIKIGTLQKKIAAEEPFVFVLVNDNVYRRYAQEFKKAGFAAIPQKESAWYAQKAYTEILGAAESHEESRLPLLGDIAFSARRFIEKNRVEFSSFTLSNGIPVTVKRSDSSSTAVLSITIAGGELLFADKVPGLASVLADAIAVNTRRQLDLFASNGAVSGFYEVGAQTLSTHSIITVTCLSKELGFALQAAYTALVFCDISPALADGVTYDERTQWRLKSGSSEFQLLCEAVRLLYGGTDYPLLYRDTEDKPADSLDFTKIQEAYPILLDASRFSLILAGGIESDKKLRKTVEATFGGLGTIQETKSADLTLPRPDFSRLESADVRVQLRHLFLTDISKDKAGPRPAVLVPTTKFLDPVLYCLDSPDLASADCALFDAVLLELSARLEAKLAARSPETKVKAFRGENDVPFARIVVTNVERTVEVDGAYSDCVAALKADLAAQIALQTEGVIDLEKSDLLSRLENGWLMAVIAGAGSQSGTARLIQIGGIQKNARLYLDQYEAIDRAKAEDYLRVAERYFAPAAPLRLYSKDSRR